MLAFGLVVAAVSLVLGLNGWDMGRLWLYGLISAMAVLMGVQLIIFWVLLRVLDELSQREMQAQEDLLAGTAV